jgi:hypothetical protein
MNAVAVLSAAAEQVDTACTLLGAGVVVVHHVTLLRALPETGMFWGKDKFEGMQQSVCLLLQRNDPVKGLLRISKRR